LGGGVKKSMKRFLLGFYFLLSINVSADVLEHINCRLQLDDYMFDPWMFNVRRILETNGYRLIEKGESIPSLVFRYFGGVRPFMQIFQNFPAVPKDYYVVVEKKWEGFFENLPRCKLNKEAHEAKFIPENDEGLSEVDDKCDSP